MRSSIYKPKQQTNEVQPLLLSAAEAAKSLGVCQKSLWSQTAPRGPIRCVRLGVRVLYSRASLEAFIAEQEARAVGAIAAERDGAA